jgi:hypothetical protein
VSSETPSRDQPGRPERHRPSPPRNHGRWDLAVGVGSLAVLVGAISAPLGAGGAEKSAAVSPGSPPSTRPAPRPSLNANQQAFMDRAASQYGMTDSRPTEVLKIGNDICGMLSQGSSVDYISGTVRVNHPRIPARVAQGLVDLATSDLCPISMPTRSPAS